MYHRHLFKVSVLLTTFVAIPLAGQSAYAAPAQCDADAKDFQAAVLQELNRIRSSDTQCGDETLPPAQPLVWNDALRSVAAAHSNDMATNNFASFVGSDGVDFGIKADQAGYPWNSFWGTISVNMPNVPASLLSSLRQPDVCAQLVSDEYEDVGASCTVGPEGSDFSSYWTLFLGKQFDTPAPVGSATDGR